VKNVHIHHPMYSLPLLPHDFSTLVRHRRIRSRTMCIVNEEIEIENRERGWRASRLDTDAGLAPMSSLGVVSDGVVCAQTDPLGDRSVLLLRFRKLLLGAEGLLGRHRDCW